MESGTPLGSRQVCESLQRRFPELLQRHKDPIASVTTVLNRLVDYAEARCFLNESGRRVWQWISERENGTAAGLLFQSETGFTPRSLETKQSAERRPEGTHGPRPLRFAAIRRLGPP